jgi:hypothetical protein
MTAPNGRTAPGAATRAEFNRRQFLRGVGAAIALPAFASLAPFRVMGAEPVAPAAAAVTATGAPLRSAFVFFPNGAIPGAWWPKMDGSDFEWSPTLQPLQPHKDSVQVLGGLNHQHAEPGPDGAGDHARGGGTFLTGVRLKKSATDIRAGISIDQVLAREAGQLTRFPSLELTCDSVHRSGACDSGYACAYQFNLSWRSPNTPMTPEANPRLAFERLFGSGPPGQRQASLERRQQEQRSILDFVRDDARAMQRRLNSRDGDKLDQYLTSIREIEQRIAQAEKFAGRNDPDVETPAGIPPVYGEYVQVMYELLAVAFQSDSTRFATLLLAHDGSNRSFDDIGITEGHHDLTHHQNREEWIQKVSQIDLWYTRQFAKFLERLQNTKDVDGNSLLHNSMIVYGGGNADANRHTHANLPIVLAGAGGGTLNPGRFIKHDPRPMTNLFLSLADRMGLTDLEKFGDSTGRLDDV